MTALYYEAHITVRPILDDGELVYVREQLRPYGFRVAKLLMRKGGAHEDDSFITGRSADERDLVVRTLQAVHLLQRLGVRVLRYKLETATVDSKLEDVWGVL